MWRYTPSEARTKCVRLPYGTLSERSKKQSERSDDFFLERASSQCGVRLPIWGVRLAYGTPSRAKRGQESREAGPKPSGVGHPDAGTSDPFAEGECN